MKLKAVFLLVLFGLTCMAQPGQWIAYPSANNQNYGVYHFRKTFELSSLPAQWEIDVSADNRYNLFVNGQRVAYGPAKGDLKTWKYDVVDIAPYLQKGENVIAAVVYNGGKDRNLSMFSVQTAFLIRDKTGLLNTDTSWKAFRNEAYRAVSYYDMLFKNRWFYGFYACGPGDEVDAGKYPWGWEEARFDDSNWLQAEELNFEGKNPWNLVPRNIAFMDNHRVEAQKIRRAVNVTGTEGFLSGKSQIKVPANTVAEVLFDYEIFTTGYPELKVKGGRAGTIKLKYAEALYEAVNLKGHRDSVNNLTMYGVYDIFHPDGAERTFRPLWKRTARYVSLEITTADQPMEIESLGWEYSGYPYADMGTFVSDDDTLNQIFTMSQRTLRLCSGETYYDTPYYEQLSYGGDNRPIGHSSVYNSADDRLFREVMRLYPQSVNTTTGLMKSAYPSRFDFDQGTWSLAWIQSLNDYFRFRGDSAYVRQFEESIDGILAYYERLTDESTHLLGQVDSRNFMDWSITKGNIPRTNEQKVFDHNIMLTAFYAYTLDATVALYTELGITEKAAIYRQQALQLKAGIKKYGWNPGLGLFRDEKDKEIYSQHTNILAILADFVPTDQHEALLERILNYDGFDEYASTFYQFFLFKAMEKLDKGDLILGHLDLWKKFIHKGLSTVGETGFASHDRSDCHAWSAHPAYYFLSNTAGIMPAEIGFNKVLIHPHLGHLNNLTASMPHPTGKITVTYQRQGENLLAKISLPANLSGTFRYNGKEYQLKSGENSLTVR